MQVKYKNSDSVNRRISGGSLLDGHVWSPFGRSIIAYRTWADDRVWCSKQCPLMNGTATYQWTTTQATEATSQSNCPKKYFDPLFGHPKDIATETGDTHVRDTALPSCKFSRQSGRDICSEAKIVIFPYMGLPGGATRYRPTLYILESSRRADFKV